MAFRNVAASLTLDVSGYVRGIGAAEADTRRLINMLQGIGRVSAFDETTADVRQLDRALDDVPASARRAGSAADNAFDAFSGELEQLDDRTRHVARAQDQIGDAAVLAGRRATGALSTVGREATETAADARKAALSQEQIGTAAVSAGRLAERAATEAAQSLNLITAAAERAVVAEKGIGVAATASASQVAAASRMAAGGAAAGRGPVLIPGAGGRGPGDDGPSLLGRGVGMAHTVRSIGFTIAGFEGIMRLASGLRTAVVGASDLNESLNKTRFTFGESAPVVIGLADEMRRRFGQSRSAILDAAAGFGLIGKAAHLSNPEAAEMSSRLARLAVDAQSFFNVPLPEVLMSIKSGLVGEAEPMRRFGVLLDENSVKSHAYAMGIARVGAELTQAQKVQARGDLILNAPAMKAAMHDMERTADQFANRMRILGGRIREWAVDVGTAAIPSILRLVSVLENAGKNAGPFVAAAFDKIADALRHLRPFFENMLEVGGDLGNIFMDLARMVGPFVGALAAVAATGIIATLNGVSDALQTVTGFLADNEELVKVLAIAYGATLAPRMVEAAMGFQSIAVGIGRMAKAQAASGMGALAKSFVDLGPAATRAGARMAAGSAIATTGTRGATLATGQLTTALVGSGAAGAAAGGRIAAGFASATAAIKGAQFGLGAIGVAVGAGLLAVDKGWDMRTRAANQWVQKSFGTAPQRDVNAMRAHINEMTREYNQLVDKTKATSGDGGPFGGLMRAGRTLLGIQPAFDALGSFGKTIYPNPFAVREADRRDALKREIGQETEALRVFEAAQQKRVAAVKAASDQSGVSEKEAARIIAQAGIDVEQNAGEATAAVIKLKGEVDQLAAGAGVSGDAIASMFGDNLDAAKAFLETVTEVSGKIGDAFRADMDVTTHIEADPTKITDALNQIAELRKQGKEIPAELAKIAQSPLAQLKEFYAKAIPEGQTFGANYMKAIAAGFDPALLERIMLQGPEKAGPLLTALVSQQGLQMVDLVNKSEAEIRRQGAFIEAEVTKQMIHQVVVQQLTTKAVDENAGKRTTSLTNAIKVQDVIVTLGTGATYSEVARITGLKTAEIQKIVDDWGLTLFGGIDRVMGAFITSGPTRPGERPQRLPANATGNVYLAAEGRMGSRAGDKRNAHQPEIVRAGAWRVFAEDETGGELYAPLANDYRRPRAVSLVERVAGMFGYEMVPKSARSEDRRGRSGSHPSEKVVGVRPDRPRSFAAGDLLPAVPKRELEPYNIGPAGGGRRGLTTTEIMRQKAVEGVNAREQNASRWLAGAAATDQARAGAQMGAGGPGTWRTITNYLSQFFIPHTVTSSYRPGPGSYHGRNKAVDLVGNMPVIFRALLGMQAQLAELFYDPAGFYIKNARRVPGAIGDHSDHVHAAVFREGGLSPGGSIPIALLRGLDPRLAMKLYAGYEYGGDDYRGPRIPNWNPRDPQHQRMALWYGIDNFRRHGLPLYNNAVRFLSAIRGRSYAEGGIRSGAPGATERVTDRGVRDGVLRVAPFRLEGIRDRGAGVDPARDVALQVRGRDQDRGQGAVRPDDLNQVAGVNFVARDVAKGLHDRILRGEVGPAGRAQPDGVRGRPGVASPAEVRRGVDSSAVDGRARIGIDPVRERFPPRPRLAKSLEMPGGRGQRGLDGRNGLAFHDGTLRVAPFAVPSFATGGTVPGPVGKPVVAVVHGGEQVQRVGAGAGSRTSNVNVKTEITIHATGEVQLTRELERDLTEFLDDRDRNLNRRLVQDG